MFYIIHQAAKPTTALCPGMRCRTVYNNILDACAGFPGVESALDTVRQGLDAFDQAGNINFS